MFLNFQKITSARMSNVIVNSESIMLFENDPIYVNGVSYPSSTRIEIERYTSMGFHTLSTVDQIADVLKTVDATGVFDPDVCGSDLVYPALEYPLIRANKIFNYTVTELEEYVFNPNVLVSAEESWFTDQKLQVVQTGLMVVLRDINPRRILTNLTFNDLRTILGAVDVPT